MSFSKALSYLEKSKTYLGMFVLYSLLQTSVNAQAILKENVTNQRQSYAELLKENKAPIVEKEGGPTQSKTSVEMHKSERVQTIEYILESQDTMNITIPEIKRFEIKDSVRTGRAIGYTLYVKKEGNGTYNMHVIKQQYIDDTITGNSQKTVDEIPSKVYETMTNWLKGNFQKTKPSTSRIANTKRPQSV